MIIKNTYIYGLKLILLQLVLCVVSGFFITNVQAVTLFSDDFESGFNWTASTANFAGVGTQTSNSPSNSMYTRGGVVTVTSPVIDTSSATGTLQLSVWIRKGDDTFSENPETGDNLEFGYMNSGNTFVVLETFVGGGTQGQIYTRTYDLSGTSAVHANFQVRARQTNGSGGPPANGGIGWDYWHIDDVVVTGTAAVPIAEWRMDETTWAGTSGEVIDEKGSFNADALNNAQVANTSPAKAGDPGTCGYGTFPFNTSVSPADAVDTGLTINSDVGNKGTITLWYYSNANWNGGGDRQLLDAGIIGGANGDIYFFLTLLNNGQLRYGYEDTVDSDYRINSPVQAFTAGTWVHIAVTWDLPNDTQAIYINGTQVVSGSTAGDTNTIGALSTLYIGDNNGVYIVPGDTTANSANGGIDEVRVFDTALNSSGITTIMNETHPCTPTPTMTAYYRMDETWTVPTADVVLDYSGNSNHADTISSGGTTVSNANASPAFAGDPGTCGYGDFPNNTNNNIEAIDTKFTPGDQGSVTFWYNSNVNWNAGTNRLLFDASKNIGATENDDRHFFLVRRSNNNGSLRFVVEDNNDVKLQAQVNNLTYAAGVWVHIGITWDLPNNIIEIYVNGSSVATDTLPATSGVMGNIQSLYLGDNRDTGTGGNGWSNDSTNGFLDEVRIYDGAITATDVQQDYNSTHPCTLVDHYKIEVLSSSPGACDPVEIKITAHNVIDAATNVNSGTILNFSTLTGTSSWGTKLAGTGTWTPAGATATYNWPGGESVVQVEISNGTTVTENINLDDGAATEPSGSVEDPDINFNSSPIIRITNNGSSAGAIATEIAGKNSNQTPAQTLYIQLKQSGIANGGQDTCEASGYYSGTYNVQVAAECINPVNCAGQQVSVNSTPVNTYNSGSVPGSGSWTTVSFTFDGTPGDLVTTTDNKAPLVINYPDAGQMILHFDTTINPPGPGGFTPSRTFTGSSNNFVVRPFGFRIDNFSPANPAATDSTGGVFTKAGQDFTANFTAVVWQLADDNGSTCDLVAFPGCLASDGIPDSNSGLTGNATTLNFGNESTSVIANMTHTLRAPSGGSAQSGTLTGSGNISGFVSGVKTGHTMNWNEVGIIQLDVTESNNDYLGGGQDVTGKVPYLGRFTPANLTVQKLGTASFDNSCSAGSFTYLDQTFYYGPGANNAPRIRIRGVDANGNVTRNYDSGTGAGGFWKLNNTTLPRTYTDAAGVASTLDPPIAGVNQDTDVTYQNMGNYNGLVNLRLDRLANGDPFLYQRVSEEAPFNASVNLTFNAAGLIDDDGVCYDGDGDTICDGTTPTPLSTDDDFVYGTITGTELRFGRLVMDNAFGSELLPLDIPLRAEYYDGNDFITNATDVCSTYKASDVTLLDVTGADSLVPGDTTVSSPVTNTTLINGVFDAANPLTINAPGTGKTGSLDVQIDLSTATGSSQEWLRYDWDGDSNYDNDPTARATWGIFSGPDEFIYIREPW